MEILFRTIVIQGWKICIFTRECSIFPTISCIFIWIIISHQIVRFPRRNFLIFPLFPCTIVMNMIKISAINCCRTLLQARSAIWPIMQFAFLTFFHSYTITQGHITFAYVHVSKLINHMIPRTPVIFCGRNNVTWKSHKNCFLYLADKWLKEHCTEPKINTELKLFTISHICTRWHW